MLRRLSSLLGVLCAGVALWAQPPAAEWAAALDLRRQFEADLFRDPVVVGVGVGLVGDGPGLHVYVRDLLARPWPDRLRGVPVRIIPAGPFRSLSQGAAHRARWDLPVPMGVQTTNGQADAEQLVTLGTLGFKACDRADPSMVGYVTNNHIAAAGGPSLCPDLAADGTPQYHPLPAPRGARLGELARRVPIRFDGENRVDAAFVRSDHGRVGDRVLGIGWPSGEVRAAPELPGKGVQKSGRTSGRSPGRVVSVGATIEVNMGGDCGSALFIDQIIIEPLSAAEPFAAPGDSGAAVWDEELNLAGVLFAGGYNGWGAANPAAAVLDQLGLTLQCPAPPEAAFRLEFPPMAMSGEGPRAFSLWLFNPSPHHSVHGTGRLRGAGGEPVPLQVNGEHAPGSFSFHVPAGGLQRLEAAGRGISERVAALEISAGAPLGAGLGISNGRALTTGLWPAPPANTLAAPMGAPSGGQTFTLALRNHGLQATDVQITFAGGAAGGTQTVALPALGIARISLDRLFAERAAQDAPGTLLIRSAMPLTATWAAGGNGPGVQPLWAEDFTDGRADFPHFGIGGAGAFAAELWLFNPSDDQAVSGTAWITGPDGRPVAMEINRQPTSGRVDFTLGPLESKRLKATGDRTDFQTGALQVHGQGPLRGAVLFYLHNRVAAVVRATELWSTGTAPVLLRPAGTAWNTGMAIHNPNDMAAFVEISLRDDKGRAIGSGPRSMTLPAGGQAAVFLDELFPEAGAEPFTGTISVASSTPVAALVLAVDDRALVPLPVVAGR